MPGRAPGESYTKYDSALFSGVCDHKAPRGKNIISVKQVKQVMLDEVAARIFRSHCQVLFLSNEAQSIKTHIKELTFFHPSL